MSDVHCLHCGEPWDLHHMQHDLIKDIIMDYGLWPDLREDLLGPMYPDADDKSRKAAAAAAKRAEKKLAQRWYKPLKNGTLAECGDVIKAFARADWVFVNGNVGRILRCSCCDDPYVPLTAGTLCALQAITTGHADDCYSDDGTAMRIAAEDPGRRHTTRWKYIRDTDEPSSVGGVEADVKAPCAIVLSGGGEALGIPVPDFNPVYIFRDYKSASAVACCTQHGWRYWYVRDMHVVAMVYYQDNLSLAGWRDKHNPPKEFGTFADFLNSEEALYA